MSKKDTKAQIMDGQKILGFIFDEFSQDTNEIAQFFENGDGCEKVDNEDKENLCKIRTMKFPKWSIKFEESYSPAEEDSDDFWSGDINSEDMYFSGEVAEFKIWLNKNRQKVIEAFNLSADKIKKLDAIVKQDYDKDKKTMKKAIDSYLKNGGSFEYLKHFSEQE